VITTSLRHLLASTASARPESNPVASKVTTAFGSIPALNFTFTAPLASLVVIANGVATKEVAVTAFGIIGTLGVAYLANSGCICSAENEGECKEHRSRNGGGMNARHVEIWR